MVTPLMLLLSSITPTLGYDHPVDTMYLSRNDRALILKEVNRFGKLINDESQILTTIDATGEEVCDTAQILNGEVVDVSQATAVILTRLKKCYDVFKSPGQTTDESDIRDIDTDDVILKLEGNPRYIHNYVFSVMENTSLDYDARILRLAELYNALVGFNPVVTFDDKQSFLANRFREQGDLAFWQRLIYHDWMRRTLEAPEPVTLETLRIAKKELRDIGFYGFVNPWVMYTEFSGSRVNRKVELNVDSEVVEFLNKVVLSGGVKV